MLLLSNCSSVISICPISVVIVSHHDSASVTGNALSWLSSYLASRSFVVNFNSSVFDQFPLHQGVPVLLFVLFSSFLHHPLTLSTLISDSTCGHHLYADDTQLFISFAASDFSANILCLHAKTDLVFPTGCLQIAFHSIKLKLSFSSLVYLHSSLKSVSCETQNVPLQPITPSLLCMHYPLCQFSGFLTWQCSSFRIHFHCYYSPSHHLLRISLRHQTNVESEINLNSIAINSTPYIPPWVLKLPGFQLSLH